MKPFRQLALTTGGTFVRVVIAHGVIAVLVCGPGTRPASAQTAPPPPAAEATIAPPAAPIEGGVAHRFLRDVAGDYKHFISKETAVWLGAGGGAALAVHAADDSIAEHVQESDPVELTGGANYGSQWLHIPVALAVWGVSAAAGSSRFADTGRDLLRAQISVVSWTYAVKVTTNRTRPNDDPHSFPSGHASTSFATAMVLQEHFGWKAGLPAFAAAAYAGASRITANQHWASDVVFGAAVGAASGRTVTLHLRNTRFSFAPLAAPGGGGVLVTALRSSRSGLRDCSWSSAWWPARMPFRLRMRRPASRPSSRRRKPRRRSFVLLRRARPNSTSRESRTCS